MVQPHGEFEGDPQIQITGPIHPGFDRILTQEALGFLADLHRRFNPRRQEMLRARVQVQNAIDGGEMPTFPTETAEIRKSDWNVAATPDDLQQRWVEITGPTDRKMMINALNSGADIFMADLEDANSPTWENMVQGQINLCDAVRHEIRFEDEDRDRVYELNDEIATLLVRPRGWHLDEEHVLVDGEPISASLFDFGLYVYHNAQERSQQGSSCYFYLPKLEHYREARLWNDVFVHAQEKLGIPQGSFRATVLIETILAALQMEEILYELREHMSGLNAGRWDYIFSVIKKFRNDGKRVLPDRAQVTMTVPFMRAYTELMVQTCHKRGAHAIGGMAAFIPSRRDPQINEEALAKVRADKEREANDGCDGSWVAHPDLVSLVHDIFQQKLNGRPNQVDRQRPDVEVEAHELTDTWVPGGTVTESGLRTNVDVSIQYINAWLMGNGAAAIYNLMEDTATAEISRSQIWQWIHRGAILEDGRAVDRDLYRAIREDELAKLGGAGKWRLGEAAEILDQLVLTDEFIEFLTWTAYHSLD